ncbi:hypothetical protein M0811_08560 [Anaeramoeba ignava]|uniref:Uncharacterized protein n=1 Tax=Anaeramoeba ignava TaxID=1746090 RepID=A0A9Q0LIJ4_ANAIG|nr:hypothetical protein M0811_08560 [Anaeramoeba ignava]
MLTANDGKENDLFGFSISISKDENILLIGASDAIFENSEEQGKVYIFQKNENENKWNQIQILTANDWKQNDWFGWSISISKDDNILLIGAPRAKVGDNKEQGKVYIFQKNENENKWNQIQILTANDGKQNDLFGFSISISKDDNILLIGAPYAIFENNEEQGKVYIFQKNENENKWNKIQILTANDGKQYNLFGFSISISKDDNILLIGAPYAKVGDNEEQGKVYIFQKNENENKWNQIQILTANDGKENDWFGESISISKDDNILLIGAPYAKVGDNEEQGKVYIFQKNQNQNKWNQIQILTSNDGKENDRLGFSISISKDGNILLIGAPYAKVGDNEEQGKAYIFQKNENENKWNQIQILTANNGKQNDLFGFTVLISDNYLIISAPKIYSHKGRVYLFNQKQNNSQNQSKIEYDLKSEKEL